MTVTTGTPRARASMGAALTFLSLAWSWLFLIGLLIFFEVWTQVAFDRTFLFNAFNIQSVLIFTAAPLLLALGQTLVIIAAGIDLSVGFIMGLASVVMAVVMRQFGVDVHPGLVLLIGIVAAFVAAVIPGLVNGVLIARLAVPPFIGTLGMFGVARGAGFLISGGATVPVNNTWLFAMGSGKVCVIPGGGDGCLLNVPIPVLITIVLVIAVHYVLSQTRFGQYTYAIGGNREAAIRSGINVRRHTVLLYVLAAACAGVAGMIFTARFSAGSADAGEPLLIVSIAAVVIGGASLFGGSGTIVGTLIGALIVAVIQFGLVVVNVEPFWQFVAVGVVIIVSVLVDQAKEKVRFDVSE